MVIDEAHRYVGIHIGGTILNREKCVEEDRGLFIPWNSPPCARFIMTHIYQRLRDRVRAEQWKAATLKPVRTPVSPLPPDE